MASTPPYLVRVHLKEQAVQSEEYPFSLPIVRGLDIEFASPVTFFVGENAIQQVALEDTSHFQITRGILLPR